VLHRSTPVSSRFGGGGPPSYRCVVIKEDSRQEGVYSEQTVLTMWTGLPEVTMQLEIKKGIPPAANETAYNRDRRAHLLALNTADVSRADQRRISYSLIDSSAGKWRYPPNATKV
jgi:hypothetical protein